eukprot:7890589-Pyramimonas_sp.AAC.1
MRLGDNRKSGASGTGPSGRSKAVDLQRDGHDMQVRDVVVEVVQRERLAGCEDNVAQGARAPFNEAEAHAVFGAHGQAHPDIK